MLKWVLVIVLGVVVLSAAAPWLSRRGLGHLPGDVTLRWKGRTLYLPITTTVLLSAVLTLIARLV
jgi:hypothetical protein